MTLAVEEDGPVGIMKFSKDDWLMKTTAPFILTLLLIAGCQGGLHQLKPDRGDQGEIYVYLQPLSPEAQGLRITAVRAIGVDGQDYPLKVSASDLRAAEMKRQRLVASGLVPPGLFSGIRFTFETSADKDEEKAPSPKAPEETAAEVRFDVRSRKAVVLSGIFGVEESDVNRSPFFTLSVPRGPLPGFAGYISNTGSGTVTVFDKRRMEVTNVIVMAGDPRGIALDQTGGRLYVALPGEDSVEIVDTLSQETVGRVLLRPGDEPSEIGISRDGRTVIVADYGSDSVSFIDGASLAETDRVRVGNGPYSVLIDDAGRLAYVFNSLSNSMSILDIGARAVTATIAVATEPMRGAFSSRGDLIYVIHKRSPYILAIDASSLNTAERIYAGGLGVDALLIDRRSGLIYAAKRLESTVTVFAPSMSLPAGFIVTEGAVRNMALDLEENRLYAALPEKSAVAVVNLLNRKIVSAIDTEGNPYAVNVMGTSKERTP